MKGKKIISFALALIMLISVVLSGSTIKVSAAIVLADYKDVKASDWFYKDVMYAGQLRIMKGYDDNTFKPNQAMSISSYVQLLLNSLNIDYSKASSTKTTPKHITKALQIGILQKGEFNNYNKALTRGEMSRLLNRVIKAKIVSVTFPSEKSKVVTQIKDYSKMNKNAKDIAYTVYGSGIVRLLDNDNMGFSQKATRAEIASALLRLTNSIYRIFPITSTPVDFSNTISVEDFTTQLLKAVGKSSSMNSAYNYGYVRSEAEYPSYQKPILRREAALTVARLMDDVTDIKYFFTRGDNDIFLKGVDVAFEYPDYEKIEKLEEWVGFPSPIFNIYSWEEYRGNIADIYQITEEYQKEMVTLYLAGFIDVDKNQNLRPYDFLTKEEASELIQTVKSFASLNPRKANEKLLTMIRPVKEKALPSVKNPSNARLWGETYPYVKSSLYEYVKSISNPWSSSNPWGNLSNIQLYNRNSDSLYRDPQIFKNFLNTRYTVDYRTLNCKADYYSTYGNITGTGDFLERVLFFYNSASSRNFVQQNSEETPRKDRLYPDDIIKKEITTIKNNKIVMQSEAVTHKSLLYDEEATNMLVTLRTIYYPETSEDYLKNMGLEAGVWYEQDICVRMIITTDGPEEYRDRWETSCLVDPYIDELGPIRKMK